MKSDAAIAKTRERLRKEFLIRKQGKLDKLQKHKGEIENKIKKLNSELEQINSKILEVENMPFQDNIPSKDKREEQSRTSKRSS